MTESTAVRMLTDILRASLTGSAAEIPVADGEVWQEILRISGEQKIAALVYQAVYSSESFCAQDDAFKLQFRKAAYATVAAQSRRSAMFLTIYGELRRNGITPLVLKGHVCRELYPKPDMRPSADEDLLVRRSDFSRCHAILKENGFVPCGDGNPHSEREIGYLSADRQLKLEVSVMPFAPESAAGRNMNSLLCGIYDSPVVHRVDGVRIFSPGHTDHMMYLILHAFKHFIHSGVGIRQLCDIVMYTRAYGESIDWKRIGASLRKIRAERWFATVMVICEERLGLDRLTCGVPDSVFTGAEDTAELIADIMSGGIYGTADIQRTHSSGMTLAAVELESGAANARREMLAKTLFPSAAELEGRYGYLKKHPYLLPFAWCARIVGYGVRTVRSGRDMTESYDIGKKRVALLEKYGILR